jgi:hypothetical protein
LRLRNLLGLLPQLLLLLLHSSCRQCLNMSWQLAWLLLLPLLLCRLVLTTLLPLLLLLAGPLPLLLLLVMVAGPLSLLLLLAGPLPLVLLLLVGARPLPLLLLLPLAHRPTVAALDASAVCAATCAVVVPAAAAPAAKGHTAAPVLARLSTTTPSSCLGPLLVCAPAYPFLPRRPCTVAPGCFWVSAAGRGVTASTLTFAAMRCCLPAAAARVCASVRALAAVSRKMPTGARPCCATAAVAPMGCSSK